MSLISYLAAPTLNVSHREVHTSTDRTRRQDTVPAAQTHADSEPGPLTADFGNRFYTRRHLAIRDASTASWKKKARIKPERLHTPGSGRLLDASNDTCVERYAVFEGLVKRHLADLGAHRRLGKLHDREEGIANPERVSTCLSILILHLLTGGFVRLYFALACS